MVSFTEFPIEGTKWSTVPWAAAAGATTARTPAARLLDIKNVKDFGAVGNGSTDDTAAIQAAVDYATSPYSSTARGIIFFPVGNYISGTINVVTSIRAISFVGAPGARITGNVAGALINRPEDSPFSGVYRVECLELYNTNAAGKGILLHSVVGATIIDCSINAWIGAETFNAQSTSIIDCDFIRPGAVSGTGSHAIIAGNATAVINCDVSGYEIGMTHQNAGLLVLGGRWEANGTGMIIGQDEHGASFQSSSFSIQGPSMEDNDTGILIRAGAGGVLSGVVIGSGNEVDYGFRMVGGNDVVISGMSVSATSGFTQFGISNEGGTRIRYISCSTSSWNMGSGHNSYQMQGCNNPAIAISALPIDPEVGDEHWVTDANAPALGNTVASGGSTDCIVRWAPSGAWKVVAI